MGISIGSGSSSKSVESHANQPGFRRVKNGRRISDCGDSQEIEPAGTTDSRVSGPRSVLRSVRENIEARALLEAANQRCLAGMELEEYLRRLVGEAESAAYSPERRKTRPGNLATRFSAQVMLSTFL